MTPQVVSTRNIIAKIYRDLNVIDPHWETNGIEWTGEALDHIGWGPQVKLTGALLEVTSHNAALPATLLDLVEVFHYPTIEDSEDVDDTTIPIPLANAKTIATAPLLSGNTGTFLNTYYVDNGFIVTTFETGVIGIVYKGLRLDANGFPYVPDEISFKDAILWYTIMKLILGGWKHPANEIDYKFARSEWLRYCSQARNKAKSLTTTEMAELQLEWVSLLQSPYYKHKYYNTLGTHPATNIVEVELSSFGGVFVQTYETP